MMIFDVILHEKVHVSEILHCVETCIITKYWVAIVSHVDKQLQYILIAIE